MANFCAFCGAAVARTAVSCPTCGRFPGGPLATSSSSSGVTAIVLVLGAIGVIFFGGIVAAIAIPNLLTAMQRSRQKRTMVDLRSVGGAVEAYAGDRRTYPDAAGSAELKSLLEPTYIRNPPLKDGWDNPFRYTCLKRGARGCAEYELSSAAKDGLFEAEPGEYTAGPVTNFSCDIVYQNGHFVRYAEGVAPLMQE